MEDTNKTPNKNLASGKKNNSLALTSLVLGIIFFILIILALVQGTHFLGHPV